MGNLIDLTNQCFGELTVIERDTSKKGETYWLCKCSCGKTNSVTSKNLRKGKVKSCGCKKSLFIREKLLKDLTGQKFNRLTPLKLDEEKTALGKGTYWICQCDCGNVKSIASTSLLSGKTHSCGCYNADTIHERNCIDLTGQRFGKLIVIEWDKEKTKKNKKVYWKCKCDCGNFTSVIAASLTTKNTMSCGCLKSSLGEENIIKILNENNINFIREYVFKELEKLRFDFYLPNLNRLIEFDGQQHFNDNKNSTWNKNGRFEQRKQNDEIKNNFAIKNGYDLIRIPYWERDNITLDMILGDEYLVKGTANE